MHQRFVNFEENIYIAAEQKIRPRNLKSYFYHSTAYSLEIISFLALLIVMTRNQPFDIISSFYRPPQIQEDFNIPCLVLIYGDVTWWIVNKCWLGKFIIRSEAELVAWLSYALSYLQEMVDFESLKSHCQKHPFRLLTPMSTIAPFSPRESAQITAIHSPAITMYVTCFKSP